MKTLNSPLEIWYSDENMRPFLKINKIIKEEDGKIAIPAFKCSIEKFENGRDVTNQKEYAFYYQKMCFMLDSLNGDYISVIENWKPEARSFLCGKGRDTTITLL